MSSRLALLAFTAVSALTGCDKIFGDGSGDAHAPGADLGSFNVIATITQNTCGEGALGEQSPWQFTVRLEKDPGVIYWNNGQAVIPGAILADGVTFSVDSSAVQNMRDPNVVGPLPCSILRTDHAGGTLNAATDTVTSFTGTLSYTYAPTAGSTCDDLVQSTTPVVAALPCGFTYAMTGAYTGTTASE
jgi:hypothetical protein